jgi:tRNA (guanine37-N1)-methyltransferase
MNELATCLPEKFPSATSSSPAAKSPPWPWINGIVRLLPGTVGKTDSLKYDSFQTPLLDYPHYTRPATFRDWTCPEVLLSGNHQAIADWRLEQQIERTKDRRPDLYEKWMGEKKEE